MTAFRKLWLTALASLLVGCTVGPNYHTPEVAVPAAWTEPSPADGLRADSRWWQAFGDDTLDRLVQTSTAQNLDAAQALDRLGEARGRVMRDAFLEEGLAAGRHFRKKR